MAITRREALTTLAASAAVSATAMASQVPPAEPAKEAKAPSTPVVAAVQNWDYLVMEYQLSNDDHVRQLKTHGDNGWEMVTVIAKNPGSELVKVFYKRPK